MCEGKDNNLTVESEDYRRLLAHYTGQLDPQQQPTGWDEAQFKHNIERLKQVLKPELVHLTLHSGGWVGRCFRAGAELCCVVT